MDFSLHNREMRAQGQFFFSGQASHTFAATRGEITTFRRKLSIQKKILEVKYNDNKNYESYYRSARLQVWTILNNCIFFIYLGLSRSILISLDLFVDHLVLSWTTIFFIYLGLSWSLLICLLLILFYLGHSDFIPVCLLLSQAFSGYLKLSRIFSVLSPSILVYLSPSCSISVYLGLSRTISSYNELSQICLAISGYQWSSRAISGYLYQVSSIRVQVEAGESKILLFETFPLFSTDTSYNWS